MESNWTTSQNFGRGVERKQKSQMRNSEKRGRRKGEKTRELGEKRKKKQENFGRNDRRGQNFNSATWKSSRSRILLGFFAVEFPLFEISEISEEPFLVAQNY